MANDDNILHNTNNKEGDIDKASSYDFRSCDYVIFLLILSISKISKLTIFYISNYFKEALAHSVKCLPNLKWLAGAEQKKFLALLASWSFHNFFN